MISEQKSLNKQSSGLLKAILLILIGLAINLLFSNIVKWLELPLYIDNVGIILTSALGGYIPGIAVGYITNAINGISDATSYYYGTLSVINAVIGAYGAHRGWFKKIPTILLTILLLTVSGGVLGSILTWMLYGFDPEYAKPIASKFYESGLGPFWAQFWSDVIYDVIDKTITVLLVLLLLYLVDKLFKIKKVDFNFWHQTALTEEELIAVKKNRTRKMSLRSKILILLAGVMIIIAFVTTGISFMLYRDKLINDNADMGRGITNIVAEMIDPERIDEYILMGQRETGASNNANDSISVSEDTSSAYGTKGYTSEYRTVIDEMERIARSQAEIAYVYVVRMIPEGYEVIFDADVGDENLWQPGQIVPYQADIEPYIDLALNGEEIPAIIMNDEYGWLLSIFNPVYDKDGKTVCYSCTDINMDHLLNDEKNFLAKVISLFVGFFVLVLAIFLWLTDYCIIYPLNSIAIAARDLAFNLGGADKEFADRIRSLGISTGDEIETMHKALVKTSNDMVNYVADIEEKQNTINKMQNALITVLANMVESRDKYTGHHVKNTAAYAKIILDELKKIDKYKNIVTEEYENVVINSAPLHDVGKIKISDALLNKPGKLNDEEFAIMKSHTIAGKEIIEEAANMVSDSAYLNEAKDLAAYHHEKWNGSGYPYGLHGEDIPLSARIMAVADVFDALVSKRSYKPGFPVERAMSIIRDGAGTHFDPEIVDIFLKCENEVRQVAQENFEKDNREEV
ncbi:MAG: HD domain-containing protein [Lachnospiraceae bacterium]|nr:HD domain-containing protein [Lachnospiraceae bacterium]